jgi:hypothetical protein
MTATANAVTETMENGLVEYRSEGGVAVFELSDPPGRTSRCSRR